MGSRTFVLEAFSFPSIIFCLIIVDHQPVCFHTYYSSSGSIPLLPLFCPLAVSLLTSGFALKQHIFTLFSYASPFRLLSFPPLLAPEVRSDTVPGRGAECCADVAVESRGDLPGAGAALCLHIRSVRPTAIHSVLAERRRDEGLAASGPTPGPGQPQ